MSPPQRHYTLDDYFAVEETSLVKHAFLDGEIFAMAGASLAPNDIAANILVERWQRGDDASWSHDDYRSLADVIALAAVPVALPLREAYREVFPTDA